MRAAVVVVVAVAVVVVVVVAVAVVVVEGFFCTDLFLSCSVPREKYL